VSRSLARLTLSLAVAAAIGGATAVTPAIADPTAPATGGEIVQVALTLTGSSAPALAFARSEGLHVDLVTRHTVLLSGPASQAADAFGARLRRVSARGNPAGATRYLAPAAAPIVPAALRGAVSAVIGLDNRPVFERHMVPAGYTANDLGTAYGTNEMAGAGAGITVGTVQFDGWFPSDATTYAAAAGITIGTNQITTVQLPHSNVTPDGSGGDQKLDRVEAFGNVIVTTPSEIAQGEKAVYSARTGIALLTGSVKLTRGRNQANGDFLELNLNNGLYKLGCRPGTGSTCVRGLFVPERQGEGSPRR